MIPGGFRHYEQSVRVVEKLEKDGKGLNLTKEVRDGILCHTRGKEASTLEGRIVKISDRIAYINHDIDDAQRAGVLLEKEIPEKAVKVLGASRTARINTLVHSLVENSRGGELAMEPRVQEAFDELHAFMYEHVYHNPCAKGEEKKVPELVEQLFDFFMNNPQRLPDQNAADRLSGGLGPGGLRPCGRHDGPFRGSNLYLYLYPQFLDKLDRISGEREKTGIGPLLLRRNHSSAVRLVGRAGEARGRAFL